jgi:hypothetical protein
MSNHAPEAFPAPLTEAKRTSLARELFTSNFWMSGLAMVKYIPRYFRVKQVDGNAFFTEENSTSFGTGFSGSHQRIHVSGER